MFVSFKPWSYYFRVKWYFKKFFLSSKLKLHVKLLCVQILKLCSCNKFYGIDIDTKPLNNSRERLWCWMKYYLLTLVKRDWCRQIVCTRKTNKRAEHNVTYVSCFCHLVGADTKRLAKLKNYNNSYIKVFWLTFVEFTNKIYFGLNPYYAKMIRSWFGSWCWVFGTCSWIIDSRCLSKLPS